MTGLEMASLYGVAVHTLHFYEQRNLLQPRHDRPSGLYTRRDYVRLQIILKGRRLGLSLSEIERLIHNGPTSAPQPEALGSMTRIQLLEALDSLIARQADTQAAIDDLNTKIEKRSASSHGLSPRLTRYRKGNPSLRKAGGVINRLCKPGCLSPKPPTPASPTDSSKSDDDRRG